MRLLVPSLSLADDPELLARLAGTMVALGSSSSPVEMPEKAEKAPAPPQITVTVTPAGKCILDEKRLTGKKLADALAERHRKQPDATIVLSVHTKVPYRLVVQTMDALKAAGFDNIVFAVNKD